MTAADVLATKFVADHPPEPARTLDGLSPSDAAAFLGSASQSTAAAVLEQMLPTAAAASLESVDASLRGELLPLLSMQACIRVLRGMSRAGRSAALQSLPQGTRARVERLLRFAHGTAGAAADPAIPAATTDTTVGEARRAAPDPRVHYLYVVDRDHKLVGVIHRRDLDNAQDSARLSDIMVGRVKRIPALSPMTAVLKHPAWRDLDALPVVEGEGVYVGVIRHKSLRGTHERDPAWPVPRSLLATALELGELYWMGLSSLMQTVAAGAETTHQNGEHHER